MEKKKMVPVDMDRDGFSHGVIKKYAASCFGLNSWEEILAEFEEMFNSDHGTKLMVALSDESKSILRLNLVTIWWYAPQIRLRGYTGT